MRWRRTTGVILGTIVAAISISLAQTNPASQPAAPDRSTPSAGLQAVIAAVQHDDAAGLMDGVLLSMDLHGEERLALGRRLVLGTQLQWLLQEKFGAEASLSESDALPLGQTDVAKIEWRTMRPLPWAELSGATEEAMASTGQAGHPLPKMARTSGGWKLELARTAAAQLSLLTADASWRSSILARVLQQTRAGTLNTLEAVRDALLMPDVAVNDLAAPDRSAPEGTISAVQQAIDNGDVATVADSFVMMGGDKEGLIRRVAEDYIVCAKLAKAWRERFGPEQGDRLASECLTTTFMRFYGSMGWVIDGDVGRGVRNRGYRMVRMLRSGGIWRIELLPPATASPHGPGADAGVKLREAARQRRRDVLEHLDQYSTVGAVVEALNTVRVMQREAATRRVAQPRAQAIQPATQRAAAATPQEAFVQGISISLQQLGKAWAAKDAAAAAKSYWADGDDGSYLLARERRRLSADELLSAADKEVDSGASLLIKEFHLVDCADDMMSIAMIQWTADGDRATGTLPEGMTSRRFWVPTMRRVGKEWKIDVSDEVGANPKKHAQRATAEAEQIEKLTQRVQRDEFKSIDELRQAMRAADIRGTGMDY